MILMAMAYLTRVTIVVGILTNRNWTLMAITREMLATTALPFLMQINKTPTVTTGVISATIAPSIGTTFKKTQIPTLLVMRVITAF